jgi:hypothetical protein
MTKWRWPPRRRTIPSNKTLCKESFENIRMSSHSLPLCWLTSFFNGHYIPHNIGVYWWLAWKPPNSYVALQALKISVVDKKKYSKIEAKRISQTLVIVFHNEMHHQLSIRTQHCHMSIRNYMASIATCLQEFIWNITQNYITEPQSNTQSTIKSKLVPRWPPKSIFYTPKERFHWGTITLGP